MEPPEMPLGRLIAIVHRHWERARRRRLAALGVTPHQFAVLKTLEEEGPLCHRAVADRLDLDPATLSRMVRQMEGRGWIHRMRSPGDRRQWRIELRLEGRVLVRRGLEVYRIVGEEVLGVLDEAGRQALRDLLLQLLAGLLAGEDRGEKP